MTSSIDDFEEDYDDFEGFDDEDEKRGVSGLVVLLIILAMLLAFSFIVSMAYSKGLRQGSLSDTPQIAADPEPVKTSANGGTTASLSTENREVYDRFDGNDKPRTEVLGTASEEPIIAQNGSDPIGDLAAAAQNTASDIASTGQNKAQESIESVAARATNVTNSVRSGASDAATKLGSAARDSGDTVLSSSDPLQSVIRDAVEETPSRPAVSVTPASNSASAVGSYVVQVGAFRSQEEADSSWARLNDRFVGFLSGKSKDIEFADLGSKGVYYRLRIAGFNTKQEASSYCEGLKARSQDCLVKSR